MRNVGIYIFKKTSAVCMSVMIIFGIAGCQFGRSVSERDVEQQQPAPQIQPAPPATSRGIAGGYTEDAGIQNDKRVIFAEKFESPFWATAWSELSTSGMYGRVDKDVERGFIPLSGRALRVKIPFGKNLGLDLRYKFAKEIGEEPEEIYFRYYIRFTKSWYSRRWDGKLPGLAGRYNRAGWGGRKSNGTNGWSARGLFAGPVAGDNPLGKRIPVGTYLYHADMKGKYGDHFVWTNGSLGMLQFDRWYSIEQYVKLNAIGRKDGVFRAWVDGHLAFTKTDIRFRSTSQLKIEEVWMNVYHGGRKTAPKDLYLYIDNVVVAHRYIGPMVAE